MQKAEQKNRIKQTAVLTASFFALTVFYCFVKDFAMESDSILYSLFLGDFSIGYCSRMIIGEIISWFKPTITREWLTWFLRIVTFIVFAVICHYAASAITKIKPENKAAALIFGIIFIINPFSFTVHAGVIFEFGDIFCLMLMLFCLYSCESKYAIWLIPAFLVAGAFVHMAFLTAYLAPCLGFVIYFILQKYGRSKSTYTLFALCVIFAFAAGIYTVAFGNDTLKMTETEVLEYMAQKGNTTVDDIAGYIEQPLFYKDVKQVSDMDYGQNFLQMVWYLLLSANQKFTVQRFIMFSTIIPFVILVFSVWVKASKNAKGFWGKIPYILFMLSVLPQILSITMSTDTERFISPIIVSQILFLFMCLRQKDENVQIGLDFLTDNKQYFALPMIFSFLTNIV